MTSSERVLQPWQQRDMQSALIAAASQVDNVPVVMVELLDLWERSVRLVHGDATWAGIQSDAEMECTSRRSPLYMGGGAQTERCLGQLLIVLMDAFGDLSGAQQSPGLTQDEQDSLNCRCQSAVRAVAAALGIPAAVGAHVYSHEETHHP